MGRADAEKPVTTPRMPLLVTRPRAFVAGFVATIVVAKTCSPNAVVAGTEMLHGCTGAP